MLSKPTPLIARLQRSIWTAPVAQIRRPKSFILRCRPQSTLNRDRSNAGLANWPFCWTIATDFTETLTTTLSGRIILRPTLPTTSISFLVILLTPVHIDLLNDRPHGAGPRFLNHLLSKAFRRPATESHKVDILIAIVDRIPARSASSNKLFIGSESEADDAGVQGISVAVLDESHAAPDLWSEREVSSERDTMTIRQRCTLSFSIEDAISVRKIQLPVANTLFLNGKTSTVLAQRWTQRASADANESFELTKERSQPEQTIKLMYKSPNRSVLVGSHVLNALKRISTPRSIAATVGNIIQRIHLDKDEVPASQELEKIIHDNIAQGHLPAERAEVWALIAPQDYQTSDSICENDIVQGCRLHKILSGGGGWGIKQGLLSLDPDATFKSNVEQPSPFSQTLQDLDTGEDKVFDELFKPGETITFFMNQVDTYRARSDQVVLSQSHLIFGALPSTMDETPEPSIRPTRSTSKYAPITRGVFGMLSEQGMSYEYTNRELSTSEPPPVANFRRTKLDAPYMLLAIQAPNEHNLQEDHTRGASDSQRSATNNATPSTPQRESFLSRMQTLGNSLGAQPTLPALQSADEESVMPTSQKKPKPKYADEQPVSPASRKKFTQKQADEYIESIKVRDLLKSDPTRDEVLRSLERPLSPKELLQADADIARFEEKAAGFRRSQFTPRHAAAQRLVRKHHPSGDSPRSFIRPLLRSDT